MRYRKIFALLLTVMITAGMAVTQDAVAQTSTGVRIKGSVFGGGNEADVKINTTVNIGGGTIDKNIYGGGNLGDVGTIVKNTTNYNYKWTNETNPGETYTYNNTGVCTVNITGGTVGSANASTANHASGHVFGAGKGATSSFYCEKGMVYKTNVSISKGKVYGNVYGGGEVGRVENNAVVSIEGTNDNDTDIKGGVFGAGAGVATHGYSALLRGNATVTVQGKAKVGMNVYGGGEIASVGRFRVENSLPKEPLSGGNCTVTIQGNAQVGIGSDGGSVYGACKGVEPDYEHNAGHVINTGESVSFTDEDDYLAFLKTLALTSNTTVTIDGNASVNGSVYGGGRRGITLGSVAVNMTGGTVANDVYGGGALADTNTGNWNVGKGTVTGITVGETVVTGYFTRSGEGTNESPYVYAKITTPNTKAAENTTYYSEDSWAHATLKSAYYTTTVRLRGGVVANAYGGGLGDANTPAYVWGNVLVDLNGTTTYDANDKIQTTPIDTKGCIVNSIFGCNNVNGTPKGEVLVHVHATQSGEDGKETVAAKSDKKTNTYDVEAVYGGGNQAEYNPVNATSDNETTKASAHTNVIIDGCLLTSIESVYGGGNAASTPSTSVTVNGAYEIGEVFGGGNGKSTATFTNPGANVGFHDYHEVESTYPTKAQRQQDDFINTYVYGSGKASVNIFGGTVHRVFGGSNTKGNVRITAVTMLEDAESCEFCVDEAYGGGKSAPMDAEAKLHMACIPGLRAAYGGAEAADVLGDVTLNITNGTFDRVFGGNNLSGTISGSITVNIEETGCKPIIIGELYGGGNQAAYSVFGYKNTGTTTNPVYEVRRSNSDGAAFYTPSSPYSEDQLFADPQVNVKSFTSIGNIYGGGLGTTATMVGNPTVNVSVANGKYYNDDNAIVAEGTKTSGNYPVPSHAKGKIGAINNVYGGGNAADVVGNTKVNIGTDEYVFVTKEFAVGASVENYYIRTGAGTAASPYTYTSASGTATENTTYYERIAVIGADIRGNVYGGGEGAETTVTGDVVVNIGGQKTDGTFIGGDIAIGGSVYGGSALGAVNATRGTGSALTPTANATTAITLKKGTVTRYVFGGGQGNSGTKAHVYGKSTVTLYGDVVAGGLYGGCDANGEMHGDTQLDLLGGTVGTALDDTDPIPDMVFGGGLGQTTTVDGNVTVNVGKSDYAGETSVTIWGNVYGGGALGDVNTGTNNTTLVNLFKGKVNGNVFGGGLGQAAKAAVEQVLYTAEDPEVINGEKQVGDVKVAASSAVPEVAAEVKGNATVKLNENNGTCEVTGSIFGSNNTKGSPKGHVLVHVFKTVKTGNVKDPTNKTTIDDRWSENATYDLSAVYGGGNKADYVPTSETDFAEVIIEGCDETSIKEVYGGGYGAAVPATEVKIKGAYLINEVFGGGYGAGANNDGANVGYYTYKTEEEKTAYTVGNGKSQVKLYGGMVYTAYGGSNTKGNIRNGSSAGKATDIEVPCSLQVKNIYGAGKNADQDGGTDLVIGCIPGLQNVYGGAKDANIRGGVNLVITGGDYVNVFGGNDTSGTIQGPIKVFIEETCDEINIQNLYLGGNLAPYSVYGYYDDDSGTLKPRTSATDANPVATGTIAPDATTGQYEDPQLYVTKFTSVGNVYGGGYGASAVMYGNPTVNINEVKNLADNLGEIGNVFGGGNEASVIGNPTVNIGTETTVTMTSVDADDPGTTDIDEKHPKVLGAKITGNVFGGGNEADVSGNTYVNICGTQIPDSESENGYTDTAVDHSGTEGFAVSIGNSVYGGGNAADVLGNTFVTFADGYVFNGIFGGGLAGSVGTYTRDKSVTVFGHTPNHDGCIGKPTACTAGGTCYIVVSGGQIGPIEVATQGMNRTAANGGPVPQGWVWGGGCGLVEDPSVPANQDTHFKAYVNNTDVTIKDNAFILESIIGGGEFGRVLGNTLVKIQGGQIGVGENKVDANGKPIRYDDDDFIDPTDTNNPITESNALVACSHFKFEAPYNTYDPYADSYKAAQGSDKYPGGSTDNASDGKTWIGCVFAGGSGYMPVVKAKDANDRVTDYEWVSSAGWVEGDAEVRISGGHILSNVYGGNEITSIKGKSTVTMTGGTIGVPRTKDKVLDNPMTGNLFGAGKGDPRSSFDTFTNVQEVEVNVSGGIIYGSVYGGSENGHVLGDAAVNISGDAKIGTWGASYIDGNVYGGGMGSTTNVNSGLIKGNTDITISNGTILHNIYGGGAYGSVGTFTYNDDKVITACAENTGTARVTITGGTFGTTGKENGMVFGSSRGDVGAPGEIHDKLAWVYDTHVTIGTQNSETGPAIKGSVYGSGENGHTYNDAEVIIHSGTVGISDTSIDGGAAYLYRGNVYGGGCGTDKYDSDDDGTVDSYNPLAGIVRGDATIRMTGGIVVHNMYGAGAMGSVGTSDVANSGKTTIDISGGIIGVSGTVGDGNVFGAARGDKEVAEIGLAQVRETSVTISSGQVKGNVYGGGEVGNVGRITNQTPVSVGNYNWDTSNTGSGLCTVTINGGKIGPDNVALSKDHGNVYGGGKGVSNTFECEKAMVYKTNVTISNGSIVNGTVYGGGEVGRVENNTVVTIGTENGTDEPEIKGNVFAAGAGTKTHGYSALVRGTSSVTVQGKAKVLKNVYGGGEEASVGRYKVKTPANENDDDVPASLPYGMPAVLLNGGTSTVVIQDQAVIGTDNVTTTGHVYGAGQGVDPHEVAYTYQSDETKPSRMVSGNTWEYFANEAAYLQFVETLALTGYTDVTIDEGATVKGSVFGGSESGFVYHNTDVKVQGGTIKGDAFGGGRGLATFAEAGRVSGNTEIAVSGGAVEGNVYGGGNLGDVGTIKKDFTTYNYTWKNSDCNGNVNAEGNDNTPENNKITGENKNTGVCKVTISGGTIGIDNPSDATKHGNVFGAGEGLANTFWCEKATAYATNVSVTKGTVKGNVYGGGQIGRVEDDAKVTIGTLNGTDNLVITGSVFGAGAGVETHGYSALVRGNTSVTVEGNAKISHSVYGGGEIASVGKYGLDEQKMPSILKGGGYCYVTVKGNATIEADVFGAGEGVKSHFDNTNPDETKRSRRMTLKSDWTTREGDNRFEWDYLQDLESYSTYLETLALATHPEVTIDESASIGGSVFGGGELGLTKGSVIVNIQGGTIAEDVYGGGKLANTNTTSTVDLDGDGITETVHPTTTVNLLGGLISGDAYGGGLGDSNTPAIVYGDVKVNLNGLETDDYVAANHSSLVTNVATTGTYYRATDGCVIKGYVFGCNNINGTPKGHTKVHVFKTKAKENQAADDYDVKYVFGGGNAADYVPDASDTRQSTEVIIEGCDLTSIEEVYGGGYGAATPGTNVLIKGTKIINNVYGGGYGAGDNNPGANVGYLTGGTTPYGKDVDNTKAKIAVVEMMAGTVRNIYGGSNTKGDIRGGSSVITADKTNEPGCCTELSVEEIYGGGKEAPMEGGAEIVLGCMPEDWIGEVYAGAREANVGNDVSLTITSGKFEHVYGGNRSSGEIDGYVEVNIEECPTCGKPGIVIGELYGGGNLAPYTLPDGYGADYQSPRVNVHSFTSIGTIYGGGYGEGAIVKGNPTVNINVGMVPSGGLPYDPSNDNNKPEGATLYPHETGKIGVIGNVFGGGNAAKVEGNTTVNIGTSEYEQLVGVIAGETVVNGYYTRSGTSGNYVYTKVEPTTPGENVVAEEDTLYYIKVIGADIQGNVYGGGNNAEVTGNTNVVIGKKKVE